MGLGNYLIMLDFRGRWIRGGGFFGGFVDWGVGFR